MTQNRTGSVKKVTLTSRLGGWAWLLWWYGSMHVIFLATKRLHLQVGSLGDVSALSMAPQSVIMPVCDQPTLNEFD